MTECAVVERVVAKTATGRVMMQHHVQRCDNRLKKSKKQRTAAPLLAPSLVEGRGAVLALGLQAVRALAIRVEVARRLLLAATAAVFARDTWRHPWPRVAPGGMELLGTRLAICLQPSPYVSTHQ